MAELSLLSPRFDMFMFRFPDDYFAPELKEKYAQIFTTDKQLIKSPVEFLNQTIVSVDFLGLGEGTINQQFLGRGDSDITNGPVNKFGQTSRVDQNRFAHPSADLYFRSARNPLSMLDKTLAVTFRHTLGFWNYFFMFEQFFYQCMRDTESDADSMTSTFQIQLLDGKRGSILSQVSMFEPLIDQMEQLNLSYQQVHPASKTFQVKFKFNNIDYQFLPTGIDYYTTQKYSEE